MEKGKKRIFKDRIMRAIADLLTTPGFGISRVSYQVGDSYMLLTVRDAQGYPENFEVRISGKI